MADSRLWFKLDVGYLSNPKVAAVAAQSPLAVFAHIESIAYSRQHLTDGLVPAGLILRQVGATEGDGELLLEEGLWEVTDRPGRVTVHDYAQHNQTRADVQASSEKASKAARTRWGNAPSNASSNAAGNAPSMEEGTLPGVPAPAKAKRKHQLPEGWHPTDSHRAYAGEHGLNLDGEAMKFRTHATATGRLMVSWDAAFTTWLMRAKEYAPPQPASSGWSRAERVGPS